MIALEIDGLLTEVKEVVCGVHLVTWKDLVGSWCVLFYFRALRLET